MTTTITVNEIDFDVVVEGSDIVCQSPDFDIVIEGAYEALKETIIQEIKFEYWDCDSISMNYDPDRLRDLLDDSICQYALDNFAFGKKLVH